MRGGRCAPACCASFTSRCCSGSDSGGEGVQLRSIVYVAHLVFGLMERTSVLYFAQTLKG